MGERVSREEQSREIQNREKQIQEGRRSHYLPGLRSAWAAIPLPENRRLPRVLPGKDPARPFTILMILIRVQGIFLGMKAWGMRKGMKYEVRDSGVADSGEKFRN